MYIYTNDQFFTDILRWRADEILIVAAPYIYIVETPNTSSYTRPVYIWSVKHNRSSSEATKKRANVKLCLGSGARMVRRKRQNNENGKARTRNKKVFNIRKVILYEKTIKWVNSVDWTQNSLKKNVKEKHFKRREATTKNSNRHMVCEYSIARSLNQSAEASYTIIPISIMGQNRGVAL